MVGLCCCKWAFSSFLKQGLLLIVVLRLLIAVAFLVVEPKLSSVPPTAPPLLLSNSYSYFLCHGLKKLKGMGLLGILWAKGQLLPSSLLGSRNLKNIRGWS